MLWVVDCTSERVSMFTVRWCIVDPATRCGLSDAVVMVQLSADVGTAAHPDHQPVHVCTIHVQHDTA